MFMIGNFLFSLANIIDIVFTAYYWLILARALISWVNPDPFNPIVQFLRAITEPVLSPLRRIVPMGNIGFDFSPIIAFLIIIFLKGFLTRTLIDIAVRIR